MPVANTRKISGSAGTVVSLAAAVFMQLHPNWTQHNPYWVNGLYISALVMCLYTAAQWTWVQRLLLGIHHEPPLPPAPGATTATASVHAPFTFAPIINNQTGGGVMINGDKDILSAAQVAAPRPHLQMIRTRTQPLKYEPFGTWKIDEAGKRGLVVYVKNLAAEHGEKGAPANSIYASINFTDEDIHSVAHVSKAYWLKESVNEVNIPIETEMGVVIGTYDGCNWTTYENEHAEEFRLSYGNRTLPKLSKQAHIMMDTTTVTLRIISRYSGETLLKYSFLLIIDGGKGFKIGPAAEGL
jgi:hypothetical protein